MINAAKTTTEIAAMTTAQRADCFDIAPLLAATDDASNAANVFFTTAFRALMTDTTAFQAAFISMVDTLRTEVKDTRSLKNDDLNDYINVLNGYVKAIDNLMMWNLNRDKKFAEATYFKHDGETVFNLADMTMENISKAFHESACINPDAMDDATHETYIATLESLDVLRPNTWYARPVKYSANTAKAQSVAKVYFNPKKTDDDASEALAKAREAIAKGAKTFSPFDRMLKRREKTANVG